MMLTHGERIREVVCDICQNKVPGNGCKYCNGDLGGEGYMHVYLFEKPNRRFIWECHDCYEKGWKHV